MNHISEIKLPGTALSVPTASQVSTIIANDPSDILGKLAAKVAAHKPDATTNKGRSEIRSLAAEIASSKMDLIRLGKGLTETWRTQTKAVNAECNIIEERMDALKEQVRAPLTAWEQIEKDRVAGHEAALAAIVEPAGYGETETAAELNTQIDHLNNYPMRDWQEFSQRAADTVAAGIVHRSPSISSHIAPRNSPGRTLVSPSSRSARLEAARAKAEHEAKIAAEAAERARMETLRAAAEERARVEREAAAAQAAVERERQIAEDRAHAAEAARVAAEHAAEAAAAKAIEDAAELARRVEAARIEAIASAERERIAAVQAEQKRAADLKAAEEAAEAERARNTAHRAAVNRQAVADLVAAGVDEAAAKLAITAIARGQVAPVTIRY